MIATQMQAIEVPEATSHCLRWVTDEYAQMWADTAGNWPVYETGYLKLWHVDAMWRGEEFKMTVVTSNAGSTLSVAWAHRMALEAMIHAEMVGHPMVSYMKH